MSNEVPVCDVLLEAAEYLCKLGSNLKLRSETLKEKRISKNKLRNSHAVRKAADKILLICQLSKKSLENVEDGVNKIINTTKLNARRNSTDSSTTKPQSSHFREENVTKDVKCFYIEYKNCKLRISSQIKLSQFTCAKVAVDKLDISLQDKYPVYYNCKLYRQRLRSKEIEIRDRKRVRFDDDILGDKKEKDKIQDCKGHEAQKGSDNIENIGTDQDAKVSPSNSDKNTNDKNNSERVNILNVDTSNTKSNDGKKDDKLKAVQGEPEEEEADVERNDSEENNPKVDSTNNKENKNCSIIEIPDDSDDEGNGTKKSDEQENKNDKYKHESLAESLKSNEKSTSRNRKLSQDTNSNQSLKSAESDMSADTDSVSKPLLKCVDINKLLMPTLAENLKKTSKNRKKSNEKTIIKIDSDEEYWKQKRSEVKAFKSIEFKVCVKRSSEYTHEFMKLYGISKITQSGKIVAEVAGEKVYNPNTVKCPQNKPMKKSKTICVSENETMQGDIEKVKSDLLHESDSEKSEVYDNDTEVTISRNLNDSNFDEVSSIANNTSSNNKNKSKSKNKERKVKNKKGSNEGSDNLLNNKSVKEVVTETSHAEDLYVSNKEDSDVNTLITEQTKTDSEATNIPVDLEEENNSNDSKLISQNESPKNSNERKESHTPSSKIKKIMNAKKMLLSDSDSDHKSENVKSQESEKTTVEEYNSNVSEERSKGDPIEPALRYDSSVYGSDKEKSPIDTHNQSETPRNKTNKSTTPTSKKKDVMDAKKKLLSDSESDGEQLKSTLTEVKESLLKGSDSDKSLGAKEKLKNKCRRRVLATSGSEDDEAIIKPRSKKKIKRKRNAVDSDNSNESEARNSEAEQSKHKRRKMGRSKTKPIASGSHNSDSADTDKDIRGLTNLSSLNKAATSSAAAAEEGGTRKSRRKAARPQPVIAGEILAAESDSSARETDLEEADNEELPAVTLPTLNGAGGPLETLAKDDLLDESDSSRGDRSDAEDSEKMDESGEEENLKSKRRKAANTISSDSDGGASKKDPKVSDFEEDSDDASETAKKSKRKKKPVDSDASYESSDGAGSKKKRRRIKQLTSDGSGSDSETEGKSKHGRKNIRKVMGKDQLEEATKKAAREEKERVARIIERQKMYNNLEFDESGKPDEVVLERVVLDFNPETKEPLVQVDRGLVRRLKPHQANGIKFMWNACFESVKRIKKDRGSGCILAHCMGLGKTLQVVSLTHTLLTHTELTGVKRVLVVCPLSTVLNWVNEFNMWLKNCETDYEVDVYELSRHKQNSERAYQLQQWLSRGGVCVLGYEMFRNLSADNPKKFRKKMLATFQESLVSPGPDLVVCDEGHLLKNEKTSLSQSMNRVKTLRRIVLTGTPLQNNLKEYYCMVQFVKPNLLGKYNEYLNRFVNPITNGQYTDSTEHDIRIMKRRSHVLHKMLDGSVQRRDYSVLAPFLPPKHEYVLFITLSDVQVKLYETYLEMYAKKALTPGPGKPSGFLFQDFQALQRVWTHPLVMKYNSERYEIMQQKKREREEEEDSEGSLVDFIDDDSTPDESSTDDSSDDMSDASDDSRKKSKKKAAKKGKGKDAKPERTRRGTRANPVEASTEPEVKAEQPPEEEYRNPTEWWLKLVEEQDLEDMRNSHKLCLLFDILRQCEMIGDKLLVFSQSLYSLDLIEHFLAKVDECTQEGRVDEKLGGHVGSWSPGVDYFRLDGSTSCENRSIWCKNFNREDNPRARLFLISTRAGGLGINLVAANRVVIFDVSWNPSHDVQSIFRVYRFGQKKPCYIYRFLAMGTMEEKIYERQVTKQAISKRVIDEQQIDRHYAEHDLAELYRFEPRGPEPRPLPPLPRDRLFAEMLKDHDKMIYKYHEHDSLLENKEEETLTEEERKAAWEDFENEKNRPPPAPFPNVWPQHNGLAQGLLAQQQQQMAYATLAAMLRKDMPNITEATIRDMLPMIYNANPALMQKMGEIYKYAPNMMANMNPMMNVMSQAAAGGAMGGTSGLQYEPPWQRQQRQQQQARLSQMMQHQNQMGAKYYSGGLGSRDPVAMALQQARAREMLEQRPRRPPAPPGDVVNLDSD